MGKITQPRSSRKLRDFNDLEREIAELATSADLDPDRWPPSTREDVSRAAQRNRVGYVSFSGGRKSVVRPQSLAEIRALARLQEENDRRRGTRSRPPTARAARPRAARRSHTRAARRTTGKATSGAGDGPPSSDDAERRLGELSRALAKAPNDGSRNGTRSSPNRGPDKKAELAELGISKQRAAEVSP